MKSYDKYDSKIHKNNLDRDMDEQKKKLENIYKHNDSDYKNVYFIYNLISNIFFIGQETNVRTKPSTNGSALAT